MSDAVIDDLGTSPTAQAFPTRTEDFLPGGQYFRKAVLAAAALAHAGALVLVLTLGQPAAIIPPMPDQIIDMVDFQELLPPPPEVLPPPSAEANAPVIPEIAMPVKAPQDAAPAPSTSAGTTAAAPVFLPQGQIEVIPLIPAKEVLSRIKYPDLAAKMGLEATVLLELFIDQTGKICRVTVLKDPGNGFAEAAVKAMEGITCTPAQVQGQNVSVRFRYPVRFTLK